MHVIIVQINLISVARETVTSPTASKKMTHLLHSPQTCTHRAIWWCVLTYAVCTPTSANNATSLFCINSQAASRINNLLDDTVATNDGLPQHVCEKSRRSAETQKNQLNFLGCSRLWPGRATEPCQAEVHWSEQEKAVELLVSLQIQRAQGHHT